MEPVSLSFLADDHPACPHCRSLMFVSRRTPHPSLGIDFELQDLNCSKCAYVTRRAINGDGTMIGYDSPTIADIDRRRARYRTQTGESTAKSA